jgi:CheY-like chemotaxis protein
LTPLFTPRCGAAAALGEILLIDDDEAVLRALARLLAARGYTVWPSTDARAAVGDVLAGAYDFVISDVSMPGMTGLELVATLRSHGCQIPVILLTAGPSCDGARQAIEHGAQYLTKPIDGNTLCRALEQARTGGLSPIR